MFFISVRTCFPCYLQHFGAGTLEFPCSLQNLGDRIFRSALVFAICCWLWVVGPHHHVGFVTGSSSPLPPSSLRPWHLTSVFSYHTCVNFSINSPIISVFTFSITFSFLRPFLWHLRLILKNRPYLLYQLSVTSDSTLYTLHQLFYHVFSSS